MLKPLVLLPLRLVAICFLTAGSYTSFAMTFTVTTTDDNGPGSLRQAILDANANQGVDQILFSIPPFDGTVKTILPMSALPQITDPVAIDGYSQPGSSLNSEADTNNNAVLLIELNGINTETNADGLAISAGNTTVKGLILHSFSGNIIHLSSGGGNLIQGNRIGLVASPWIFVPTNHFGIFINDAPGNLIGGTTPASRNVWLTDVTVDITPGVAIEGKNATNNLVQGNSFGRTGVLIMSASHNTIGGTDPAAGNIISGVSLGTLAASIDPTQGNVVVGNRAGGVVIGAAFAGSTLTYSNRIGGTEPGAGNVIEGGLYIQNGASRNEVLGNLIVGGIDCVRVEGGSDNNIIGKPGAGNVVAFPGAGGDGFGMVIDSSGNVIQSNLIGTDPTGTEVWGVGAACIVVRGSSNLIGGTIAGAGNLLSGAMGYPFGSGLILGGYDNVVQGNFIGTDITGTKKLGNSGDGITVGVLEYRTGTAVIGGTEPGAGNLISGNFSAGITLAGDAVLVQANFIGTDITGTNPIPNGNLIEIGFERSGIFVLRGTNVIGGTSAGAGNVIAYNIPAGVQEVGYNGETKITTIRGNSIFSNVWEGILKGTPYRQEWQVRDGPVLTAAVAVGNATIVQGIVQAASNATYALDFFANTVADPTGYGEGESFVGWSEVTTDDSGIATFTLTIPVAVPVGQFLTATATGSRYVVGGYFQGYADDVTSAFSLAIPVTSEPPSGMFGFESPTLAVSEGETNVIVVVVRTGDTASPVTVDYSTGNGSSTAGSDYLATDGTLTFAEFETSKNISIPILRDGLQEGSETFNLTLTNPTGGALVDATSTAVLTILDDDTPKVAFLSESGGGMVKVELKGPGTMQVSGVGADTEIVLEGTDTSTSLLLSRVKASQGSGFGQIGAIEGTGNLGSIIAKDFDLAGEGIHLNGFLGSLTIHDTLNGADILLGGTKDQATRVVAHVIGDGTTIEAGSFIASLNAAQILGAEITVPCMGKLSVKGDKKQAILGDLQAQIFLTGVGVPPDKAVLGKVSVANTIRSAHIIANGSIERVSAARMEGSLLSAGFTPSDEADPLAGGAFTAGARIGSLAVHGAVSSAEPAFVNSHVAATQVGTVRIHSIQPDAGGERYGLIGQNLSRVSVLNPPFAWNPNGGADQSIGDFHVKLE